MQLLLLLFVRRLQLFYLLFFLTRVVTRHRLDADTKIVCRLFQLMRTRRGLIRPLLCELLYFWFVVGGGRYPLVGGIRWEKGGGRGR